MVRSGSKVTGSLAITLSLLFSSFVSVAGCSSLKSNTPSEIGDYKHDWPTANCAYDNTRATADSLISLQSMSTLGLAWSVDITGIGEWGGMASNPLIIGGTDDILEFGGKQDGGYTTIEFKRALKTNDEYDQEPVKGKNKIIWAYCSSADPDIKHSVWGRGEVVID
jgi:hypothetical protein